MKLPKISIVTPSFNQGKWLEKTLRSVLDQNYQNLEYIVIDGGSTDGSLDVLERYRDRLAYVCSEKDEGQYAAIEKGFRLATGDIMAWINADDLYFPWTLQTVGECFRDNEDAEWLISVMPASVNERSIVSNVQVRRGYCRRFFLKGLYLRDSNSPIRSFIQQESSFWRRSLWKTCGEGFSEKYGLAADFELWGRFFSHTEPWGVKAMLAAFRRHEKQRSVQQRDAYLDEARRILKSWSGKPEPAIVHAMRACGMGRVWPFNVFPSLGFTQPSRMLRWSQADLQWKQHTAWIDQ